MELTISATPTPTRAAPPTVLEANAATTAVVAPAGPVPTVTLALMVSASVSPPAPERTVVPMDAAAHAAPVLTTNIASVACVSVSPTAPERTVALMVAVERAAPARLATTAKPASVPKTRAHLIARANSVAVMAVAVAVALAPPALPASAVCAPRASPTVAANSVDLMDVAVPAEPARLEIPARPVPALKDPALPPALERNVEVTVAVALAVIVPRTRLARMDSARAKYVPRTAVARNVETTDAAKPAELALAMRCVLRADCAWPRSSCVSLLLVRSSTTPTQISATTRPLSTLSPFPAPRPNPQPVSPGIQASSMPTAA